MIDSFDMQKRYFTAQLEKYRARPELHAAVIADCEEYLAELEECGSVDAFMARVKETGNMVSTSKAAAVDRYRNRSAVYSVLGHDMKAAEDMERVSLVKAAASHSELSSSLTSFEENSTAAFDENKALNALQSVFSALFQLCTDGADSADRNRNLALFSEYWAMMRSADPSVTWEKILSHKPYRDRLPFTDGQMGFLEGVFREVCNG